MSLLYALDAIDAFAAASEKGHANEVSTHLSVLNTSPYSMRPCPIPFPREAPTPDARLISSDAEHLIRTCLARPIVRYEGERKMDFSTILSSIHSFIQSESVQSDIKLLTLIAIAGSTIAVWYQIRKTRKWNAIKAAQDIVDRIIIGEFPDLRDKLESDYNCKITDEDKIYKSVVKGLSDEEKRKLDSRLRKMFNILEVATTNIKEKYVDEDLCYYTFGLA
jgi:hypothetical protein